MLEGMILCDHHRYNIQIIHQISQVFDNKSMNKYISDIVFSYFLKVNHILKTGVIYVIKYLTLSHSGSQVSGSHHQIGGIILLF